MPKTRSQKNAPPEEETKKQPPEEEDDDNDSDATDDEPLATQQEPAAAAAAVEQEADATQEPLATQQPEVAGGGKQHYHDQDEEEEEAATDNNSNAEEQEAPEQGAVKEEHHDGGHDEDDQGGPNDEALAIISDLIEYKSEMVFWAREARKYQFDSLHYFYNLHPYSHYEFGRIYARYQMAEIMLMCCAEIPYTLDEEPKDDDDNGGLKMRPLDKWERNFWEELESKLLLVRDLCIRKDTKNLLNFRLEEGEAELFHKPDEKNPQNAKHELFNSKFEVLLKILEVQKCLAPIRFRLEWDVDAGEEGELPDDMSRSELEISQNELEEVIAYSKKCKHDGVEAIVKLLFEPARPGGMPALKEREALAKELNQSPFDFIFFQRKLEILMQKWNRRVFGPDDPELLRFRYRVDDEETLDTLKIRRHQRLSLTPGPGAEDATPAKSARSSSKKKQVSNKKKPPSATKKNVEELRNKRSRLKNLHGDDPLESSRKEARKAVAGANDKTKAAGAANKRRRQIRDEDDDEDYNPAPEEDSSDDDDDDEDYDDHGGSKKPRARTSTGSRNKRARTDSGGRAKDSARRASAGEALYGKKKSARRLEFMEDIEADDDEDVQELVKLSKTPTKVNPFPKRYEGPQPDEGVFDDEGKVTKRRRWTDEEKNAVKSGVMRLGLGKWVQIKQDYAEILRNRTGVQCKDCWRTMVNRGEASEEDIGGGEEGDQI